MAKAFCQVAIDVILTYDEDTAPTKDELRDRLEKEILSWADGEDGLLEREIEVYMRGGKK